MSRGPTAANGSTTIDTVAVESGETSSGVIVTPSPAENERPVTPPNAKPDPLMVAWADSPTTKRLGTDEVTDSGRRDGGSTPLTPTCSALLTTATGVADAASAASA